MTALDLMSRRATVRDYFGDSESFYLETLAQFGVRPGGDISIEQSLAMGAFELAWGEALYRIRLAMMGVNRDR